LIIMGKIFYHLVKKQRDKISFNIFLYFLIAFAVARISVYTIPSLHLFVKGIHIHHLNYGIFILASVGYWALVNKKEKNLFMIAKIYGIGLGLTFDEFGMWLHLEDDYSIRLSYDAIILISIVFINIVYFGEIWKKIIKKNLLFWKKVLKKESVKIKDPD